MTPSVFVDTAALIALLNPRDLLQPQALSVLRSLRRQKTRLVTTEFVLLEVADAFSAPAVRARTMAFIDGLRREPDVRIVPVDPGLFAEGWTLYCRRPDKAWGLTDCISFAVMTREAIGQAFTSDHHFEQAGFAKLLVAS
jgi:predicted nucleic acid-binding protein